MKIITRDQWGARAWVGKRVLVPDVDRTCVVIHHTTGATLGREDHTAWVQRIDRYHQSKGWSSIGYHWLVDAAGTVYEGRGWEPVGAHCPGHNTDGWGIALLGDGNTEVPVPALQAIEELVDQAERRAGHDLQLLGHREARQTACPGERLFAWVHGGEVPGATPPTSGTAAAPAPPAFPLEPGGYYGEGGVERGEGLRRWQSRMKLRGWRIDVDGAWGPQCDRVARAFQAEKGLTVDARVGAITWAAAWTEPVT